jgi:hypothetical protein
MEFKDNYSSAPAEGALCVRPFSKDGKPLSDPFSIFEDPGIAKSVAAQYTVPSSVPAGYIPIGPNLVVDRARQILANLAGGRDLSDSDYRSWTVSQVSFGVYDEVPRFTDTTLSPQADANAGLVGGENEIEILPGVKRKDIASVDWPSPFVARWEIILTPDEAIGYLLKEMGLWTKNGNLFARKAFVGVNKTGDFGLSWLWTVRFLWMLAFSILCLGTI